jgi:hypothetical protein
VWNTGLFGAPITSILRQIVLEASTRKTAGTLDPAFVPSDMLVFVGFALNRTKVSFQFRVAALLSWKEFLVRYDLQESGLTPDMVSARLANDSAGPTFAYGHVVRHPRYRDLSQTVWHHNDLQMSGDQAREQIQYIMLTRPVKDCTLWVHTEPLGWPGEQKVLTYEDCDDEGTRTRDLMQHEKLVTLTAQFEHTLLHLQQGEAFGFQLAPRDDQVLSYDWWCWTTTCTEGARTGSAAPSSRNLSDQWGATSPRRCRCCLRRRWSPSASKMPRGHEAAKKLVLPRRWPRRVWAGGPGRLTFAAPCNALVLTTFATRCGPWAPGPWIA